jgi:hypothetical protein
LVVDGIFGLEQCKFLGWIDDYGEGRRWQKNDLPDETNSRQIKSFANKFYFFGCVARCSDESVHVDTPTNYDSRSLAESHSDGGTVVGPDGRVNKRVRSLEKQKL